jgi:dTDP-4-dehydrorhamnose 3,5-epimerase
VPAPPPFSATPARLPGVIRIAAPVHGDDRGHFVELHHAARYAAAGVPGPFVQDNLSASRRGVLRGLHFQHPHGQGKLVCPLQGVIYDVVVDVRAGSPTFGQWEGFELDAARGDQLYVPEGFAHGFAVTSDTALVLYKCTDLYHRECEASVRWDDPDLDIPWPVDGPALSGKDATAPRLAEIPRDRLPTWRG